MPTKFQIYVDSGDQQNKPEPPRADPQKLEPNLRQAHNEEAEPPRTEPLRYIPEAPKPGQRFFFDERKIYPVTGGEYCFEELNLAAWKRRQKIIENNRRVLELQRENEELKQIIAELNIQLQRQNNPLPPPPPPTVTSTNRLSIVPQSLQPTQGMDISCHYGAIDEGYTGVVNDLWKNTTTLPIHTGVIQDKFTVPIDQSQYLREHFKGTSTPQRNEDANAASNNNNNRRMSRPSLGGGSPTLKLSPIVETSRECYSKSSSSSSGMSTTPGTAKKNVPLATPLTVVEPNRPLDPTDPSTYCTLLRGLNEPLDKRAAYFTYNRSMPKIGRGATFQAGTDKYLVDKELSGDGKLFSAQLLNDEDTSGSNDLPIKFICFRVDQPANEWLYYICSELHRRLVRQKTEPDIELSVMIANPAIIYNDGSILVDEYFRYISIQHVISGCQKMNKPFPRSIAAYISLELIQVVRQMHSCDILHMNICPENVLMICDPSREDIDKVRERTSMVKLIGFDRAMDLRLLPSEFKAEDGEGGENQRHWSLGADWNATLNCIHKMFFLEDMTVNVDDKGRRFIERQFKNLPTDVWHSLFDNLLNIEDLSSTSAAIDAAVDQLNTWIKANFLFLMKESCSLDTILEDYSF